MAKKATEVIAELEKEISDLRALIETDPANGIAQEFLSKIEQIEGERTAAIERANNLAIEIGHAEAKYNALAAEFAKFRGDAETLRVI